MSPFGGGSNLTHVSKPQESEPHHVQCMVSVVHESPQPSLVTSPRALPQQNPPSDMVVDLFDGVAKVNARGFSGGIWVLWKANIGHVDIVVMEDQLISLTITDAMNRKWVLSTVYASPTPSNLPQVQSDHCPVLISSIESFHHSNLEKPFHFEMAWLTHDTFKELLHSNWLSGASLHGSLCHFQEVVSRWNKDVFGNVFKRKRHLLARLDRVQRALENELKDMVISLFQNVFMAESCSGDIDILCPHSQSVLNESQIISLVHIPKMMKF
ncbi:hypothetical protein REPUB_Repub14bG0054000 [Reevesia pubescens]